MSSIATITAFDGAATPVQHDLLPISVSREAGKVTAEYREDKPSIPVYAQVRVTLTQTKSKNGVYRQDMRVVVPVMESIGTENSAGYTAAPKVAYENTVILTGYFHERSDSAGRKLARQLALNVASSIATSVTPASTGPIPDLFDKLVSPT